ncbi:MAG: Alkaline phosphatase synthesis transcriptional regulatory protein PhoP [Phycisphaerae bacterium]|nr:Alkaline phosphatase synthesis transcriptional regulatory protein PhoP [Phycisphaerae bacterium]
MAREKILVVDDEEDILELVRYNLAKDGYLVELVQTGEKALESVREELPNLVLLDLMLPGVDGLEVCRQIRADERTRNLPIVMLTAKGEEADVVTGLELGADDYITKPFAPRVLLARTRAVLRRRSRQAAPTEEAFTIGDLTIHPGRHEVRVRNKSADLTHTEFQILGLLARKPGWVFTRNQIVSSALGDDAVVTDRAVDVHIVSIRRKLGVCGDYIETVRGVGYRMKDM